MVVLRFTAKSWTKDHWNHSFWYQIMRVLMYNTPQKLLVSEYPTFCKSHIDVQVLQEMRATWQTFANNELVPETIMNLLVELVCLLRLSMMFFFSWCFIFHLSMDCNSRGSKPAAFTLFAVVESAPPQPVANGFCRSECLGHAKPMRSSLSDTVRRKMQQMYTNVRRSSHSSHTKRRSLYMCILYM